MQDALYGSGTTSVVTKNAYNAVYPFTTASDPILEGAFGNLVTGAARYWKQDTMGTPGIRNLPAGTHIYSEAPYGPTPNTDVTLFRHATLGYIYAGDGGFIVDNPYGGTVVDANNAPTYISRNGGAAGGGIQNVANGIFFANAMAWAIQYAQQNNK